MNLAVKIAAPLIGIAALLAVPAWAEDAPKAQANLVAPSTGQQSQLMVRPSHQAGKMAASSVKHSAGTQSGMVQAEKGANAAQ